MSQERKESILQATLALVAEKGLLGMTIALIAQRAKASPGIIYHYFESKDEIVHTLYDHIEKTFASSLVTETLFDLAPEARLKQAWLNAFHYYVSHPQETLFLEQYKNSAYASGKNMFEEDEMLIRLMQVIKEDMVQGIIKAYPIEVLYELTLGVAVRLAKQQIAEVIQLEPAILESIAETCSQALIA